MTMENDLVERLRQEAIVHAGEARTANSTIYEIYQVISGATGEPGNWHGAEPVRAYVAATGARIQALEAELARKTEALKSVADDIDLEAKYTSRAGQMASLEAIASFARSALEEKTDV